MESALGRLGLFTTSKSREILSPVVPKALRYQTIPRPLAPGRLRHCAPASLKKSLKAVYAISLRIHSE
jgi:hypothetical protein